MRPADRHRTASRTLQVAAVATAVVISVATGLGYALVIDDRPSGAQSILWVGLVSLLVVLAIAGWSIRTIKAIEGDQTRAQMQVFATAVHDLRQPLQAATLFIDNLLHSPLSPQPLKAVQCLDQSMQSLRHLVDNLLEVSSLDAAAIPVEQRPFKLTALLHTLEAEFTPQAISRNLRFSLYCPPTDVCVNSDPKLVLLILRKLLIHAIAQTSQGGILLGVRQRGSQVLLQVWDTHHGMPSDPSKRSDRYLAIANRVSELIHSPLHFQSKMGRRSVWTLTLARG
jgi:signal transduction histidine kinase